MLLCVCTTLHYFGYHGRVTATTAPGTKLFEAFAGNGRGPSVPGGLVLCIVTCDSGHRDHALVWRGPRGSSAQADVRNAMSRIPDVLVHPREYRLWPRRPFNGPYLAMVSTRPQNVALRAAIRRGWGEEARYPRGAFRLIFFLAEPAPGSPRNVNLKKELLVR
ncbi:hypothetical protein V5799_004781 [Amblyomma americanum]|uniref:Uncharacterized protein n=1 Tax=Amblyomma americanum TaxID=6943 RepID=A0AAQ4D550_AMBAM